VRADLLFRNFGFWNILVEDAPPLADFIQSIEAGINLIGLEIKQVNDQETGKILYILVSSLFSSSQFSFPLSSYSSREGDTDKSFLYGTVQLYSRRTSQDSNRIQSRRNRILQIHRSFFFFSSTFPLITSQPHPISYFCTGREDHVGKGYELLRDPSRRDQGCQNSNHSNGSYSIDQIIPRQRCVLPHTLQHTNSLLTAVVL